MSLRAEQPVEPSADDEGIHSDTSDLLRSRGKREGSKASLASDHDSSMGTGANSTDDNNGTHCSALARTHSLTFARLRLCSCRAQHPCAWGCERARHAAVAVAGRLEHTRQSREHSRRCQQPRH